MLCLEQMDAMLLQNVQVFQHLNNLDHAYHVGRQTGALGRVIDRGTRGINFILSAMIFNVVPTALEVLLVAGILAYKCGPPLAALTIATLGAYTWFTFTMTAWRTQFRVQMNKMDSAASTRAVDALINYETVHPVHPMSLYSFVTDVADCDDI